MNREGRPEPGCDAAGENGLPGEQHDVAVVAAGIAEMRELCNEEAELHGGSFYR